LPHDQQKYDGLQEPTLWLSDYLQEVQILGGTRATTMKSLQLYLTGTARSWLNTLPNDSIGSWGELESQVAQHTNAQRHWKKSSRAYKEKTKLCALIYNGGV
jgi:hypothetical protein